MFVPPSGFAVGPLTIYWYSVFSLIGIFLGYYLARPIARRYRINPAELQLSVFYGIIPGIVGARAYHVIDQWAYYAGRPLEVVAIQNGGLGILGGLLGGALGLYIFARRYRKSFLRVLDVWAPSALLAQAVGRFGNWTNQEAFGPPTDRPWGVFIQPEQRPSEFAADEYFHPTFFYEAGWDLVGLTGLLLFRRRLLAKPGRVLGTYFIVYGTGRFGAEFFRFDTAQTLGLPTAHLLSALLVAFGVYLIVRQR